MRNRRMHAILAVALLSAGCTNRVFSEEPWFDSAKALGGPAFRDGIWLTEDRRCNVREAEPAERWPDCASWVYRRANQSLTTQWSESCERRSCQRTYDDWSSDEELVVAGDPVISQESGCDLGSREDASPDGVPLEKAVVETKPTTKYCYSAVRPLSHDGQGKIMSVETWPVLCGPWPGEGAKSAVTNHPWPGVTIVKENCTVASEAVLRDVAERSYEVAKQAGLVIRIHWVRDGYR